MVENTDSSVEGTPDSQELPFYPSGAAAARGSSTTPLPEGAATIEETTSVVLQQRIAELETDALYLRAEVENMRKRITKEKKEAARLVEISVWRHVFPIYVNLQRAVLAFDNNNPSEHQGKAVRDGVVVTMKELENVLKQCGVSLITGTRCPFDPTLHEALATEERTDITEKMVIEEYEPGFKIEGHIVRPAKVKVGIPKIPSHNATKPSSEGDPATTGGNESCHTIK